MRLFLLQFLTAYFIHKADLYQPSAFLSPKDNPYTNHTVAREYRFTMAASGPIARLNPAANAPV
jgi:hypothetical protein